MGKAKGSPEATNPQVPSPPARAHLQKCGAEESGVRPGVQYKDVHCNPVYHREKLEVIKQSREVGMVQ